MWWEHWFDNETMRLIDGLVQSGLVTEDTDGRLKVNTVFPVAPKWLHIAGSTDCRNCTLWKKIFFDKLGIIHRFCRYHCWKVVCKPRNVRELIQYHNLMYVVPFEYNYMSPLPGKAGIDTRNYTKGPYAAFNYATSLTEALRMREMMIHMVTKYLPNDEIDGKYLQDTIFVKRACTEMEGKIPGDSPWWNSLQTTDEWEIERRIEELFKVDPDMGFQPAWIRDKTLQFWLNHANEIGDKSLVDFIGADIFSVRSRTYDFKDIKPKQEKREEEEEPIKETNENGISNTKD